MHLVSGVQVEAELLVKSAQPVGDEPLWEPGPQLMHTTAVQDGHKLMAMMAEPNSGLGSSGSSVVWYEEEGLGW